METELLHSPKTFVKDHLVLVLAAFGNPSSEPIASVSIPDEQDRRLTGGRWRWREHIIDAEVSVRLGHDSTRVVGDIATEKRGEYRIFTCRPDVASGPNQALSFDLDVPVRLHLGLKVIYHPRLPGGSDTKNNIRRKRRGIASHRNNPNPALEPDESISTYNGEGKEADHEQHRQKDKQNFFS